MTFAKSHLKGRNGLKVAIVYHRVDFDGLCSYAVIRSYEEWEPDVRLVTGVPYNYGDAMPDLKGYDRIYIADVCLPTDQMLSLLQEDRAVIWIDHHKSSIEESVRAGFDKLPGLRYIGKGACELCHEFAYPHLVAPKIVQLLSAYDVWDKTRFSWNGLVLPFQYGLRLKFNLDAEKFCREYCDAEKRGTLDEWVDRVLVEGRAIADYLIQTGTQMSKTYGFEVKVAGAVTGLCVLTPMFGSLPYEQAAKDSGCEVVVCVGRTAPDAYKVGIYSTKGNCKVDLGGYLRSFYGGGGHHDAAGAVLTREQFDRLLTDCEI